MLEYLYPSRGAVHLWGHAMAEEASSFPGGAVVSPASAACLFGYVLMFLTYVNTMCMFFCLFLSPHPSDHYNHGNNVQEPRFIKLPFSYC